MKNCTVSVFENPFDINHDQLSLDLGSYYSQQIGNTERERWGLILTAPNELVAPIAGGYMIAIQKQERVLPGWAVNDALDDRVKQYEFSENRPLSKKEKSSVKEEVILDLLPQCFVRNTVYYAWLGKDRLLIDSKSPAVCDAITSLLREALGSLPCINVAPRSVPGAVMAGWMQDSAMLPQSLMIAGESTLRAKEDESGKIKIKDADLHPESINDALECCPMVSEILLTHGGAIRFTLNEQLQLAKIKLSDTLQEQVSDYIEGEEAECQRATWLLEVTAINAALDDIFAAMNGLEGVDE